LEHEEVEKQTQHNNRRTAINLPQHTSCANTIASLLLCAHNSLRELGLPGPSATEIITATGAGKTRAYELSRTLAQSLGTLQGGPGRPRKTVSEPAASGAALAQLTHNVFEFIYDHPGAVRRLAHRLHPTPEFKRFLVEQADAFPQLDTETLAATVAIPASTLREWLREAQAPEPTEAAELTTPAPSLATAMMPTDLKVQTLVAEWEAWRGTWSGFRSHMQEHHRLGLGSTMMEIDGLDTRTTRPTSAQEA
jgi:hypothetical protein